MLSDDEYQKYILNEFIDFDVPHVYTAEEEFELRKAHYFSAGVLQHEFDQHIIDEQQKEIQAGIERIIRGLSTPKQELLNRIKKIAENDLKNKC